MMRFHEISLWLVIAALGLPAAVFATGAGPIGNQPTVTQAPQAQSGAAKGAASASKEKTAKKSSQDVQSRGLFKKKKKKQKDGAAGHSQSAEQADAPGR